MKQSRALHIGVREADIQTLKSRVRELTDILPIDPVIIDGDGWEVWGEDAGKDSNAFGVYHAVIPVASLEMATVALIGIKDLLPVPMELPHQRGVIAVLTDAKDFSTLYGGSTLR